MTGANILFVNVQFKETMSGIFKVLGLHNKDEGMIGINNNTVLITGCAGFIGGALALRLIENTSAFVIGIDNMNDYYDVKLKEYRLKKIYEKDQNKRFQFVGEDVSNKQGIIDLFKEYKPDIVVHLAAQAGVRYSIENPDVYIESNVVGFYNMIEACRYSKEKIKKPIKHFLFASSSSVYGNNEKIPYSEEDNTDYPVSFYAATKKMDEVMAYSYSKLYSIPTTGMRFFTVYGPAGRPDMAYYKFAKKLILGQKIELYNQGQNKRDFTFIDDVIDVISRIIPLYDDYKGNKSIRYQIFNIGNNHPVDTVKFVEILIESLKAHDLIQYDIKNDDVIELVGSVPGDVGLTYADIRRMNDELGVAPHTDIEDGIRMFVEWFDSYESR